MTTYLSIVQIEARISRAPKKEQTMSVQTLTKTGRFADVAASVFFIAASLLVAVATAGLIGA